MEGQRGLIELPELRDEAEMAQPLAPDPGLLDLLLFLQSTSRSTVTSLKCCLKAEKTQGPRVMVHLIFPKLSKAKGMGRPNSS